ncbi:MAG: LLM class F420-dependent oxidoreductase [Dehalococcoidia bacterium]|nr:MAG: LLM class F420-dependent oxidoreductase [Dehalococcoidia bacterium]
MRFVVRCHQGGWTWQQLAAVWREADQLGYDGASLYDLLDTGLECWTALTALVATTRLVGIPLVLANPYRPPAVVAKMAATLDALSGGRVILGLGSGGAPADAARYGVAWPPAARRAAALEDAVRAMRLLWQGGGIFAGEGVRLAGASGAPPPATPGGPLVLIGGHGRRYLLRAAARVGDLCNIGIDLEETDWLAYRSLLDGYCREVGRDPASLGLTHNATVLLGHDESDYQRKLSAWAARRSIPVEEAAARLRTALAGTPDMVSERIARLKALGISWVFLIFQDLPDVAMMRLFAEQVLPRVR